MIKNIIFDWSGTLVDDFSYSLRAANKVFESCGKKAWSEEEFRNNFFMPFTDFFEKHLPGITVEDLGPHFEKAYEQIRDQMNLLPCAKEILAYCQSRGMKIFLLSSIHQEYYDLQSEKLGLKDYFTQAYVFAIDKKKVILDLLKDHDLNPQETLFVGDMEHDMEAAKHGGVQSCAVLTGYDSLQKIQKSEPDHLYRDLQGVLEMLQNQKEQPEYYPIPTVGALIYNAKGEVLMLRTHKWSNLWGMPGGKIKSNETALDAVHREILEETGLKIYDVKFVMIQDCIRPDEFYRPAHFLLLNYLAHTDAHEVKLNAEANEFKWVTIEGAYDLPLNKPTKKLLDAIYHGKKAFSAKSSHQ